MRDVLFGPERESYWVAVLDSLDIEAFVECVVEGVMYYSRAIGFGLILWVFLFV